MLPVPGAHLYYETRGSGPLLLLISPGGGDVDSFHRIAASLAERFTVVTYDRRGYARSPLDAPAETPRIETHVDDASRLLAALTMTPAHVFGSSGGAVIGLDLALRYPRQVRTLVAHEPPLRQLLPEGERGTGDIREIYRREGTASAWRMFAARIGVPEAAGPFSGDGSRFAANVEYFLKQEIGSRMWARHDLDIAALRNSPVRVVPAGGRTGREYVGHRCAVALARHLDTDLIEFPGHHAGFHTHPAEFAHTLSQVLT
ncbi:alpha/beta fold hydrolase [Actinoallomurus soli]|uniref:alpha/beta fold hydrolase n=1 Tax=Actinoallomurus soli TaxID=2952535 RepID=UPI0020924CCB|nr:alpha/beta hydrolase [Actinoallomurus soli]MCO5968243.1 alpha/beta hydrolase [Actinoallomurus soli]